MGDTMKLVIGIVMIAVCIIVFPIALSGIDTILNMGSIGDYTGLETMVQITPLLIWIGVLLGGGLLTFQGFRGRMGGGGKGKKARR